MTTELFYKVLAKLRIWFYGQKEYGTSEDACAIEGICERPECGVKRKLLTLKYEDFGQISDEPRGLKAMVLQNSYE